MNARPTVDQANVDDANNSRLLSIRNKHEGRRGFLIGNGPSLRIEDLDRLHENDEVTFASNKIFLAFENTPWRPTFYNMCDEVVARNNKNIIKDLPFCKVFANSVRKYLDDDPTAMFLNPKRSKDDQADVVGWDLVRGANAGHSVLNLSIKVAYWVGIREMYILGADHNFVVPEQKTGELIMNNEVLVAGGECNHFHPDYRKVGEEWTVPKLDRIEQDFAESKAILERAGGLIKNASRFSKLDVFDRVDFDSLF